MRTIGMDANSGIFTVKVSILDDFLVVELKDIVLEMGRKLIKLNACVFIWWGVRSLIRLGLLASNIYRKILKVRPW